MKKQSIITVAIVALVLIGGGAGAYYLTQNNTPASTEQTENNSQSTDTASNFTFENNVLTFKGKEGVTAETILKDYSGVIMTGSGEMAYVTSVNNIVPNPDNEYWSFYINGESSMVGVGSYVTKDSDIMTLQISTF